MFVSLIAIAGFLGTVAAAESRTLATDGYPKLFDFHAGSMCQGEIQVSPGTDSIHIYVDIESLVAVNYNVDIYGRFESGDVPRDAALRYDTNGNDFGIGDSSARVKVPDACVVTGCTFYVGYMARCKACGFGVGERFKALVSATPVEANGNRQIMMQLGKRTAKQEIPESGWVYYHFIVGGKGNILEDLLGGTKYNVSFDLNVDASSTADKRSVYIRGNSKPLDRFALLRGLPEPGEEHTQELSQANFFADYKTSLKAGFYTIGVHVEKAQVLKHSYFSAAYHVDLETKDKVEVPPPEAEMCADEKASDETGTQSDDVECEALSCVECVNSQSCSYCQAEGGSTCQTGDTCSAGTQVATVDQCCSAEKTCEGCNAKSTCSWCQTKFINVFAICVEAGTKCSNLVVDKVDQCSADVANTTPEGEEEKADEVDKKDLVDLVNQGTVKDKETLGLTDEDVKAGGHGTVGNSGGSIGTGNGQGTGTGNDKGNGKGNDGSKGGAEGSGPSSAVMEMGSAGTAALASVALLVAAIVQI